MLKMNWKRIGLTAGLALTLVAAGCGTEEKSTTGTASNDEAASSGTTSVGESLDYTITGIDPGAGVMAATEKVIKEYGLDEYELQASSGAAMTKALSEAIEDEKPIVVTGWTPHWKFAKFDLKYLEDPKNTYGDAEEIHTVARLGLKEDLPNAYKVLDQFHWTADDMNKVMLEVTNGTDIEEAAANWIKNNQEKVAEWTKGAEKVDGKEIELVYVAWDSEIASTNVIGQVLESLGFKVELTQTDVVPMFKGIATGDADAMVAAWVPLTHGKHMKDFKGEIEDLGANLEGAKTGLVVPAYMEIDSIEDLKN